MEPTVLIDVRTPYEYDMDHLVGAVNIPHNEILSRQEFLDGLQPTDRIILYCGTGMRSSVACAALKAAGFLNVVNAGSVSSARRLLDTPPFKAL